MPEYRIYYDDGYVLCGSDGAVPTDRRVGVIAVAQREPQHEWMFWHGGGKDWYLLLTDGLWRGVDTPGLLDHILFKCDELQCVLQGRTLLPSDRYLALINRMLTECRPAKTGWQPGERQ